jgi:hypothetical protein
VKCAYVRLAEHLASVVMAFLKKSALDLRIEIAVRERALAAVERFPDPAGETVRHFRSAHRSRDQ